MHDGRPSLTSMAVATIRALYTDLPAPFAGAKDPIATALVPRPLSLAARLASRAAFSDRATGLVHRGLGLASLGMTYHVALRTQAIDDALREGLAEGVRQVVVLGAGLDGRAYRMDELADAAVFEVDHPSTQRDKRARLRAARIEPKAREVRLVPVDFERDDLGASLAREGFSADEPSFWIWEGVTVYLTRAAISGTLHAVGAASAPGSRLALTYVPPREPRIERVLLAGGHLVARLLGEPIRGFIAPDDLAALGRDAGLDVLRDEGADAWAARYWSTDYEGIFEWERLAILERRAA
ncbi:SAM-dependent methyltransferase [Polyangium sp. 6x1]|uniref:class I SAM-dependent methyltransferase n=1 Tax=Polyangium sp. 6x1 TaxID=3042689 RepID=UPI002482E717|nr:SAM-dependent methyltransferase [Polyangium sp. 6x1]MDI1447264.1 SAM-dependent methyltransferase [Polyangium sp. 6x1]